MKTVKWISESRFLPGHGVAETGALIELPDQLAEKFVEQKEAEWPKQKVKESKGGE